LFGSPCFRTEAIAKGGGVVQREVVSEIMDLITGNQPNIVEEHFLFFHHR